MPQFPYPTYSPSRPTMARFIDFVLLLDTGENMEPIRAGVYAFLRYLLEELPLRMQSMGIANGRNRIRTIPFGGKPYPVLYWAEPEPVILEGYLDSLSFEDAEDPLSPFDAFKMGMGFSFRKENDVRQVFLFISNSPSFGAGVRGVSADELIDKYWEGAQGKKKGCLCGFHKRLFLLAHKESFFQQLKAYLYGVTSFDMEQTLVGKDVNKEYIDKILNDIAFSLACN